MAIRSFKLTEISLRPLFSLFIIAAFCNRTWRLYHYQRFVFLGIQTEVWGSENSWSLLCDVSCAGEWQETWPSSAALFWKQYLTPSCCSAVLNRTAPLLPACASLSCHQSFSHYNVFEVRCEVLPTFWVIDSFFLLCFLEARI